MNTLKWKAKKVFITGKDIRKRMDVEEGQGAEEYCVFKVGFEDPFDEMKLARNMNVRFKKTFTVLCFVKYLYSLIKVGDKLTLSGFLSFSYGSTFLCLEIAYDELGIVIGGGESLHEVEEFIPPH
jgi:hypothetical protein